MILVDTSVWIEVFRRDRPLDLEAVAPLDRVVICLPIIQEVLQGFRDERAFRIAQESIYALQLIEAPLRSDLFDDAVQLYRSARRAGVTVRSSVDCLIAACAIRNNVEVVHRDRDYSALAQVSPLRERRV